MVGGVAIAGTLGSVLAPLLPMLAQSAAAERQRVRIEKTCLELSIELRRQAAALEQLSDQQYKIVAETILAILQTTEVEKLDYLRNAVVNGLTIDGVEFQEAAMLSRCLRDMSAEEANFLISNFGYESVAILDGEVKPSDTIRYLRPNSREALFLAGLISLGVVMPGDILYGAGPTWRFTPPVAKLIALLRAPVTLA